MEMNRLPHFGLVALAGFSAVFPAFAQTNVCNGSQKLACLMPNLFGSPNGGLTLPNPTHSAHFIADPSGSTLPVIGPLNNALGTQLNLLPTVSPASGFVFTYDPATGLYTQSEQSFGPILSERAETLGKRKVFLGFTFQNFVFDKIDGRRLSDLHAVFTHADVPNAPAPEFLRDLVTADNNIHLRVSQFTTFVTVGITNRLDVSLAIPVVSTKLGVASTATIRRNAPSSPDTQPHFFEGGTTSSHISSTRTASGIGDLILRIKGTAFRGERSAVAIGTDIRFPSGDELDLLGSGAAGVRPFVAASISWGRFAPHVNVGYQVNGSSILAGSTLTGTKERLPDQFIYSFGADVAVHRRITAAFDYLGQQVVDGRRLQISSFSNNAGQFNGIQTYEDSFNISSAAFGLKISPVNRLLITGNLLFRLNDAGLRAKVVPLVGISYVF